MPRNTAFSPFINILGDLKRSNKLLEYFVLQHITKEYIPFNVSSSLERVVETPAGTYMQIVTLQGLMVSVLEIHGGFYKYGNIWT